MMLNSAWQRTCCSDPLRPHDWQYLWCPQLGRRAGRFERTNLRHLRLLADGYAAGKLE